jgi:hypothetical protein
MSNSPNSPVRKLRLTRPGKQAPLLRALLSLLLCSSSIILLLSASLAPLFRQSALLASLPPIEHKDG